ncbi:choline/carnitine/betaine transport [Loktanella fryxellensis]|uniref:Choline/carnitine/betaine transport n=1 Tax=Loktanella fryxellensis TaxID=245187 RepID=A0A1H8I1C1_9RHOB|nr:BCCT family transporter [Loktanella fryxellensis]SEN62142.1 choline/carnitine/betaine transport [Loktanella fryxellensis]
MTIKPPLRDLDITTADTGFYEGFNPYVTLGAKIAIGLLIVWAAVWSETAGNVLTAVRSTIDANTGPWYMAIVTFFIVTAFALALTPATGRLKLGQPGDEPEFRWFSWVSMMFGAGIGIGMLTYATAEPLNHFGSNPEVIRGLTTANGADNVRDAFKWSFLHWGLSAWACYAIVGLSLAFFSYARGLPLTIRSGLTPLFGRALEGPLGHVIDVVAVVATILGVAVTIGYGVSQFASGVFYITGAEWLMQDGVPTVSAMLAALGVVMTLSVISALSGVGRGIKWLSNVNMGLSFFILAFLLVFGSTLFALRGLAVGLWDYLTALPWMSVRLFRGDGTGGVVDALAGWQGDWTIFYWAWWIAFAPFVGLFLARISKGRTVREFILGAMIAPTAMCCIWFAIAGGTAIDLTLNGGAGDAITGVEISSQLFAMIEVMLSPGWAVAMSTVIVVLLLTYLITSADSAILIVNTIAAAGDDSQKGRVHIVMWGVILALAIGALLVAGGLDAINTAMIIGALPFSLVMVLMAVSLLKALIRDGRRRAEGQDTTTIPAE